MGIPNSRRAASITRPLSTVVTAAILLFFALPATAVTNDPYFVCPGQWGLDRVGGEWAWAKSKGAGVIIATVDSGVDLNHYDLKGTDKLLPGKDYIQGDSTADDEHGHGTLMAGMAAARTGNGEGIAAIAPDALLLPVKVFNSKGEANADDVADGIRWAVDEGERLNKPLVLNLSFTGIDTDEGVVDRLLTPGVLSAINDAASSGAAVVVASGNEGKNQAAYDAPNNQGIVVVGATGKDDKRATFSNYGIGLDMVAPGVQVISTYWDKEKGSVVASTTGTSISVPFVAGAAALLMSPSGGGLSNTAAIQKLLDTAEEIGPANEYGQGLLDVTKALGVKRETPTAPCPKPPRKNTVASVPSPTPSPSPSPTESPSPLVLPPPGEPPAITQEGAVTGLAQGDGDSGRTDTDPFSDPLRPIAGALVGLVSLMHVVRRFLLF